MIKHSRTLVKIKWLTLALLFCTFISPLHAEVKLAGVFGDHMVLQQGVKLAVWGTADLGEKITVKVAGQAISTQAGIDGKWRVTLGPLKMSTNPVEFTVTGNNTVILHDVLVGDVWLCSGQSNMEYSLGGTLSAPEELLKANHPDIRLCRLSTKAEREPLANRSLHWTASTSETAKHFSAVGYFFGRDLHEAIHCPIGLICSAVSGSQIQSWISPDKLKSDSALAHCLRTYNQMMKMPGAKGFPTGFFNGMIHPLIPFGIRGIVWYQGESNTSEPESYRDLFSALITDWRSHWDRNNLPFLFVQLPGFQRFEPKPTPSKWAVLRAAQASALRLPNTGMAVTLDLSRPRNILHPRNKREVGRRLALIAQLGVYGQKVDCEGPVFKSAKFNGNQVRITFRNADSGLTAGTPNPTDPNEPVAKPGLLVKGFSLAGADHKFVWANAVIDGGSVVVSSDLVKSPVAVRYGWDDNPEVNLYNRAGLPTAPFRTDDWAIQFH